MLAFGFGPERKAFNPPGITGGFGWLGDLLAAPAARWDSAWYLVIARYGYRPDLGVYTSSRTAFFPLYPLGLRGIASLGVPPVLAGVLLSVCALALALYGIHRLTTLELGRQERSSLDRERLAGTARLAVLLTAFAPMAFFFSAVYSESLYLALSVGLFWSARHGRWVWVGVLGALARRHAQHRARADAAGADALPVRAARGSRRRIARSSGTPPAALRPRYRLRRDVLWLALLPLGRGRATAATSALAGGDPLAPLHAQDVWSRHFAGPYVGIWDGAARGVRGRPPAALVPAPPRVLRRRQGSPFVMRRAQPDAARVPAGGDPGASWACCAGCRWPMASMCSRRSRCRSPIRSPRSR